MCWPITSAGAVHRQSAEGPHRPRIPRDWEGGLSGGPCTNASTELIRKVYTGVWRPVRIAGIGGVFTPEQAYAKISFRLQPGHVHQLADVPRPAADHRVEARSGPAAAPRRISSTSPYAVRRDVE